MYKQIAAALTFYRSQNRMRSNSNRGRSKLNNTTVGPWDKNRIESHLRISRSNFEPLRSLLVLTYGSLLQKLRKRTTTDEIPRRRPNNIVVRRKFFLKRICHMLPAIEELSKRLIYEPSGPEHRVTRRYIFSLRSYVCIIRENVAS